MAIDTGLLFGLRTGLGVELWLATTVAFMSAIAVNFTLNRIWVFQSRGDIGRRLMRYSALVALNYLLTLVSVLELTRLGLYYLMAKAIAVGTCVALNFVMYRRWVFR